MTAKLIITKSDREAAWPIWKWLFVDDDGYAKRCFMEGDYDEHHLLQSYAKARVAERNRLVKLVRRPDEKILYEAEGYTDFILPKTHDNTKEGRMKELQIALGVIADWLESDKEGTPP